MRIVTWNVQTGRPNPDGHADIDRVITHLKRFDADVVALQEVDRGVRRSGGVDQAASVAVALGGHLVWAPTVQHGPGAYGHAVVVVRGEVVRVHEVRLRGGGEPRVLLVVELDLDDRRWTVGATHLSTRARVAKDQLQTCLSELRRHPAPRVLVGDLNLPPGDVLPWSTAAGFHLLDGPATFDTWTPRATKRIDHVLVSGAQVRTARVEVTDMSDHAPIVATLR